MANTNAGYDPEKYWTDVAERIARREAGSVVAGDREPFHVYRRTKFVELLLPRMDLSGRSVLELGCGPGGNLLVLARQRPSRLVGADLSARMIDLARQNTAGTGIEVVKSWGRGLPFGDCEFDVTFTVTVLQHNVDEVVLTLMRDMARVTRHQIYLFEETSPWRREIYSYVSRPRRFYEDAMAANGFRMADAVYLRDFMTRVSTALARRALNRTQREGEDKSRLSGAAERLLVRIARPLDEVIRLPLGLTMMTFDRNSAIPSSSHLSL